MKIMQALRKLNSTRSVKEKGIYPKGRGDGIPSFIVCDPTKGFCTEEQNVDDEVLNIEDVHAVVKYIPRADNDEEHKSESVDGDSAKYSSLLMLLESDFAQDTQYGMQRLVTLANSEFVNSEYKGSVAEAIVFNVDSDSAERLRSSFLRHLNSEVLRLAALRVLASTLELAKMHMRGKNTVEVDFASRHWGGLLTALARNTEVEEIERAEATLSIKCLRLLLSLDSTTTVDSYIRCSRLSYVEDSYRQASEANDRRLEREAKGMLSSLDIHWTEICSP